MSIARQPLSARCRQGRGQGDAMAQSGRRTAQRGACLLALTPIALGSRPRFLRTYFVYPTLIECPRMSTGCPRTPCVQGHIVIILDTCVLGCF